MSISLSKIFSVLFLICAFFVRPSALGSNFTEIGLVLTVSTTGLYLFLSLSKKISWNSISSNLIPLIIFLLFIGYETSISLIEGNSNLSFLVGDLLSQIIIFVCFLIFLIDVENNKFFFSYLLYLLSFFGWSSLATLILFNISEPDNFLIFNYQMNDYPHTGDIVEAGQIYFPFSMTYDYIFNSDFFSLYRFSGFFRESGIFAAICCYSYVYGAMSNASKKIMIGIVFGIVLSFSTSGYFVFLTSIIGIYLLKNKITMFRTFSLLFLSVISLYATFQAPIVGLSYKANTEGYSDSVDRRSDALILGLKKTINKPFGEGMYSAKTENTGVNLIANIGSIGVIGFLLQIVLMSGFRFSFDRLFRRRFLILSPVFLTLLLAQSIAATPFVYSLIFVRPPEKL
tara:strand:- start:1816 stop:3012 length:1197 start_codon:yes stop_codon:yes gene_type:complete